MKYLIRITRHYYSGTITNRPNPEYCGKLGIYAPIVLFDSHDDARAWIEEDNAEDYFLGNGEYMRPTLMAVPLSRAPQRVRDIIVEGN